MKRTIETLNKENFGFMCVSSKMMCYDENFLRTLKRADAEFEKARYDGLQNLDPAAGFIFVEPLSAQQILMAINENSKFLYELMDKIHTDGYGVKKDNSKIEVPLKDRFHRDYKICLDIFGYTLDQDGSFAPVKNPFDLDEKTKLERLANLEFCLS